ncbi:MAG: hypothetical protein GY896_21080 [Gammaproteobacteria bacterium]|nr:hypothetical protein [Gammaproteobacteria bacterium]
MPNKKSVEEHLQYLELDQDSISELGKVKDILEPAMDEMLEKLYAHILEELELNPLTCNESEIEQIRSAQKNHLMEALFSGNFNDEFYEKTSRIGRAHARIGLTPDWYIGCYNQMLYQFIALIYEHYTDESESAVSLIQAVSSIIFLDMDLVINCYLEAKDESIRRILVNSTELRTEMWSFCDELNTAALEINSTAETLSEGTQTHQALTSSTAGSDSEDWDEISKSASLLLAQAQNLRKQASSLDEHLKQLPLSEKLYLPEAGLLARLKNRFFGKRYYFNKTGLPSG